jgi:GNAT superfamily N-acetyltransferase
VVTKLLTMNNIDVWMIHRDLAAAPRYAMPAGYSMCAYRPGDVAAWVRIQQAAETFFTPTAQTFAESMGSDEAVLAERVRFLVDERGEEIGTITAWSDAEFDGVDRGRIHWVALHPSAQGRGLAKPMLSAACDLLLARGYDNAWLWTGTGRTAALNLYLQFGFTAHPRDEADRAAWRDVAVELRYPVQIDDGR